MEADGQMKIGLLVKLQRSSNVSHGMAANGLGLAVRQGNRITKVQNITKDE